jgi:nitrate/nitrite-specific signal transduction histidine kinase
MKLNQSLKIVCLLLATVVGAQAVEISSPAEAINIAGKQRMLSYRIFKDYLMTAMESNYKNPKEDMERSVKAFNEAKAALTKFNDDKKLQELLVDVGKKQKDVEGLISESFDSTKGDEALKRIDSLKIASHEVVLRLQELYNEKSSVVINKAGRLRAISQKINALYLLKTMEASSGITDTAMNEAMDIFTGALGYLKGADLDAPQMQKRLKKLESIHRFFVIMNESDKQVPTIITKKSDKMLKYADELVTLYIKNKGL